MPRYYPRIVWLPEGYRLVYVARGANVGFQVPDEILQMFGNPKVGDGPPFALQAFCTRQVDVLLTGTHLNRIAPPPTLTQLLVDGVPVHAKYYDGEFARDPNGTHSSRRGARFRWSRDNKHSVVLTTKGVTIGIVGPRLGGVDEFHLYSMAESLSFQEVAR